MKKHRSYPLIATYQEQLSLAGHGRPLWAVKHEDAQIGDVGYVGSLGQFFRLFNILLPPDHRENTCYGVPADFEVLQLDSEGSYTTESLPAMTLVSPGVVPMGDPSPGKQNILYVNPDPPTKYCTTQPRGALLSVPRGATRTALAPQAHAQLSRYIQRHHRSWARFVAKHEDFRYRKLDLNELIFIGGTITTPFSEQATFEDFALHARPPWKWTAPVRSCVSRLSSRDAIPFELRHAHAGHKRTYGPVTTRGGPQLYGCVLIEEWRCQARRAPWDVRFSLRRALPQHKEASFGEEYRSAGLRRTWDDPCQDLMAYILKHSRATLAIATSDDVRAVLYSCPKETIGYGPHSFRNALASLQPRIIVDKCGVGSLLLWQDNEKSESTSEGEKVVE